MTYEYRIAKDDVDLTPRGQNAYKALSLCDSIYHNHSALVQVTGVQPTPSR